MCTIRISQGTWIVGVLSAVVLLNVLTSGLEAAPRPDEERYFDREDMQSVAAWLALLPQPDTAFGRNTIGSPCGDQQAAQFGRGPPAYAPSAPMLAAVNKRNSELINSLLSLPKTLNNAGK